MTHMTQPGGVTRRQMLKTVKACAAVTSGSMLSQMLNLRLTSSVMANVPNVTGYKATVCLFLYGGMDTFNLLVPRDNAGHADYSAARGNLAIPQGDLLPITDAGGREFGLHPGVPEMQQMFTDGDLGFVANVGALIKPTTMTTYNNRVDLPLGLFSHNDQQQHWQTSIPQSRTQLSGWAGRMADLLNDQTNSNPSVSMNIALGKLNILQTGDGITPYVIEPSGASQLSLYRYPQWDQSRIFREATDGLLNQSNSNLLNQTHAKTRRNAIDAAVSFAAATDPVELTTPFGNDDLSKQLQMVAKSIASRDVLGQTRQTFFVAMGGWDHHANMLSNTNNMFPVVSAALKSFNDAMKELGVHDDVTLFSATDFGRTLTSNGDGSDHAWGGNTILMGGGIDGGKVHGDYPLSLTNNDLDTGRGRLIPTTSVDELAADLALWFGVPNDDNLETVLPNIRNFYSTGASGGPLGIMA